MKNGIDDGLEELDSELDSFLAEIDDIEQNKMEDLPPEPDLIVWRECLDETTKHPYYWDAKTQEVTWVKPASYDRDLKAQDEALRQWKKKCEVIKRTNEERKKAAEIRKKLIESQPKPTAPRKAPRIELEPDSSGKKIDSPSGSFGKIGKFNFLKSETEHPTRSATPPKSSSARLQFTVKKAPSPPRLPSPEPPAPLPEKVTVPTHTPSGKQRTVTEIAAEIKRKKQQIALTNARIHLQKRAEEQKIVKRGPGTIAPKKEDVKEIKSRPKEDKPTSPKPENKKRRIFQEVKSSSPKKEVDKDVKRGIEKEALLLREKLEFLGGDLKRLSKFQIRIIQLETRISDFCEGHLSLGYMQSKISELGQMLREHEENAVPKDWSCTFDREEKRYRYTNKNSGKSQFTHPGEDDDSDNDSDMDKDDDLYEMFQQELEEIETKEGDKSPAPPKSPPPVPPTPPEETPPPVPDPCPPPCPPSEPPVAPPFTSNDTPPGAQRNQNQAPGFYPGWNCNPIIEWSGVPAPFPGGNVPSAPPPPPPDDGMMETYSPGNSDSEEEKERDEDLGVVSVKAPMRYSTPPALAAAFPSAPSPTSPTQGEKKATRGEEKTSPAAKKIIKKKKKVDGLLGGGGKKQKSMNHLVAKWNKVNKNADSALK